MSESQAIEHEEWRPVVGWEGVYEVSSMGRVKRIKPARHTFSGRLLKPGANAGGYLHVIFADKPRKQQRMVHQVVAEAFLGDQPEGTETNHRDGCKTNNRVENLEFLTHSANQLHCYAVLGRSTAPVHGELNPNAKLTEASVFDIRSAYPGRKGTVIRLAKKYGVSRQTILRAVTRESWSHIT